jgi:hypothetical protein
MALPLVERLTDEATARVVQLGIEYDPKPPAWWDPVEHRGRVCDGGSIPAAVPVRGMASFHAHGVIGSPSR